ncbi:hypothetical protein CI610_03307 [invertebrate metagenome]|uniref:Uncharacterized protein n=1 Tax=invertebrate metagenome TaxID=1711999 RepID=A0A2H9T3G8_9ZZZZ
MSDGQTDGLMTVSAPQHKLTCPFVVHFESNGSLKDLKPYFPVFVIGSVLAVIM